MDDEETIWRLDASSISGFAIPSHPFNPTQYETPIYHTVQHIDINVSQTLETHAFPYYLQIVLTPRHSTPAKSGIILLIPLNQILSVVISDHGASGQSLRFKLLPAMVGRRNMGIMRQVMTDGNPGRMYGVNENDPFHLLGLLKFREIVVRNAGIGEQQMDVMNSWAECLKTNAFTEYCHCIQILKEGSDGIWSIADNGATGMKKIKEDLSEKMEDVLEGELDDSLGISSIVIPDDTVHGDEHGKDDHLSERMDGIPSNASRHAKHESFDKTISLPLSNRRSDEPLSPPESNTPARQLSSEERNSGTYSPDGTDRNLRTYTPEDDHKNYSNDTSPNHDRETPLTPSTPRHRSESFSHHQSTQTPPTRPFNYRPLPLTGSNTIPCPNSQHSPTTPHALAHRISGPKRPFQRHRRPFTPRCRGPFRPSFPVRHINGHQKQYDSYRPARDRPVSLEDDEHKQHNGRGNDRNGRKRKAPHIERRD
jgi:hypothetical protein